MAADCKEMADERRARPVPALCAKIERVIHKCECDMIDAKHAVDIASLRALGLSAMSRWEMMRDIKMDLQDILSDARALESDVKEPNTYVPSTPACSARELSGHSDLSL